MPRKETEKSVVQRPNDLEELSPSKGKNYLFAIAIDAYEYCPKLYNCIKDTNRLIEILTSQYNFDKSNITSLLNEEATEGKIFKAFRNLAKKITPEDNLVIYFSGHGEYDKVFDEGYWIPVNAQLGAHEDFVSNSKIKTILEAIKSKHTFLIADSCFSGSLFTHFKSAAVAERLENDPSRWGLTAGRNEVVSDGKPGDHSPFADSLIYHLSENQKPLGVATLCNRVIEDVIANAQQTPRGEPLKVKGHRGGQFFFHPKGFAKAKKEEGSSKMGNVLYQIPNEMELEKDTKCVVRIAFDKVKLLEDLEISEERTIKSIRISNLMEVDLFDPLIDGNFTVRSINQREQFVDKEAFTQWLFFVKAKKEGTFPLFLKVTVIEVLYGKERKKEIVLEEMIEVVTKISNVLEPSFKNAGYAFSLSPLPNIAKIEEPVKFDTGGSPLQPPPASQEIPKPEPVIQPAPIPTPTPPKSSGNLYKIIGGIAAAFLFLFMGNSIFFDRGLNPLNLPKPNTGIKEPTSDPEPNKPGKSFKELKQIRSTDGKLFGFKDAKTGKITIQPQFEKVKNFQGPIAFVMKNGQWGLIDLEGKVLFDFDLDKVEPFRNKVAFVAKNNRWGLIGPDGKLIVDFIIYQPGRFKNGRTEVDAGFRKMVKINTKGETLDSGKPIKLEDYVKKYKDQLIK